jgi:hypothetical protein
MAMFVLLHPAFALASRQETLKLIGGIRDNVLQSALGTYSAEPNIRSILNIPSFYFTCNPNKLFSWSCRTIILDYCIGSYTVGLFVIAVFQMCLLLARLRFSLVVSETCIAVASTVRRFSGIPRITLDPCLRHANQYWSSDRANLRDC